MEHLTRRLVPVITDVRVALARLRRDEGGFSTAELLGNAALGVVALVVIWGLLRSLGVDLVDMIRTQLLTSNQP